MGKNLTAHQQKALDEAKKLVKSIEQIKQLFLDGKYSEAQFDNDTRRRLCSILEKLEHIEKNDGIH